MTNSRPPTPLHASDYEAIYEAMMETSRGRWFLNEFVDRNRSADTSMLLEAIAKLESAINRPQAVPGTDTVFKGLLEMSNAIQKTREEIASIKAPHDQNSQILNATEELDSIVRATEIATNDILQAAENIQEMAWTLRESGVDNDTCDDLDGRATDIYTACSFQDITGQRTQKVVHVLRYLEASLHSMIEIWQPDEAAGRSAPPAVEAQQTSAPQLDQKDNAESDLQQGQVDNVFSESDLESFLQETAFQNDTVGDAGSPLYAAPVADFTVSHQTAPHAPADIKPAEGAAHESAERAAQPPPSPGPAAAAPAAPAPAAQGEATLAPMPAPETGNTPGPLSATDPAAPENAGVVREGDFKRPTALSVQTLNDTQKAVLFNAPPHL